MRGARWWRRKNGEVLAERSDDFLARLVSGLGKAVLYEKEREREREREREERPIKVPSRVLNCRARAPASERVANSYGNGDTVNESFNEHIMLADHLDRS